jgi:hypothetical protein
VVRDFCQSLLGGVDSDQGSQARGFDFAQLGHIGQQRGSKHRANAFDLLQALRFAALIRIVVDVLASATLH